MGLGNLFGGNKKQSATAVELPPCSHAVLVPRWDNAQDMGQEAKATSFMCESCHEEFTPAQAQELRDSLAQKLTEITAPSEEASTEA